MQRESWIVKTAIAVTVAIPAVLLCQACFAAEADHETKSISSLPPGYVTSIEAATTGLQTADSMALAADYATRNGNYDQAIKYCRQALKLDFDDIDIHMSYAQALEKKLVKEPDADANVFNMCIKEWLIVMRGEVGEEKEQNFHGVNLMGHLFEDDERAIPARYHLAALTGGHPPKPWQTDTQYLKQVCKATSTVAARILPKSPSISNKEEAVDSAATNTTIFMK